MKTRIISAYSIARTTYNQTNQSGSATMSSSIFCQHANTPAYVAALEALLHQCENDDVAINVITDHLLVHPAHNRSAFEAHLIMALKNHVREVDWDCFIPNAVKKFTGTVYRGTSQPPQKIFAEGLSDRHPSNDDEDYVKFKNDSTGISTTRDFDCALTYAHDARRSESTRYIYMVNYRGDHGYDVTNTNKARGVDFDAIPHLVLHVESGCQKYEINIKGNIANDDIVGAFKLDGDNLIWIDNPHYCLDKSPTLSAKRTMR